MREKKKIPKSRLSEKSTVFFLIFFNLVRSRTSSGAMVGAIESAMEGKVMMIKVDG